MKTELPFNGRHPDPAQVVNPEWRMFDPPEHRYMDEMISLNTDKELMREMAAAHQQAAEEVLRRLYELKPELVRMAAANNFKTPNPTPWGYLEELFPIDRSEVDDLQGGERFTFACVDLIFHILDRFHDGALRADYDQQLGDNDGILAEFMRSYAPELLAE